MRPADSALGIFRNTDPDLYASRDAGFCVAENPELIRTEQNKTLFCNKSQANGGGI